MPPAYRVRPLDFKLTLSCRMLEDFDSPRTGMHMNNTAHDVTNLSSPAVPRSTHDPFAGLRVAITGGTAGLGLALVRHLLDRGAHVAFVARHRDEVARVAAAHGGSHGIVGDISDKA